MSKKVLVTGSNGFVGKCLCAHLDSSGYDVYKSDIAPISSEKNYHACDISDPASISELFTKTGPVDYVIHLAAVTFVPDAASAPTKVMDVNLNGTINLIDQMKETAPEARLLFISSSEIYGASENSPITEEHPLLPGNPYAISKAAADQICQYFFQNEGIDIVRMRPFNHSGPGQSAQFVLSSFARQVAEIDSGKNEPVVRVGNLNVGRDFMHVEDVVRAYEMALTKATAGEVYNICSGEARNIGDALKTLIGMTSTPVRIETNESLVRSIDTPSIFGSHEKFTNETDWMPKKSFQDILEGLVGYWRERGAS